MVGKRKDILCPNSKGNPGQVERVIMRPGEGGGGTRKEVVWTLTCLEQYVCWSLQEKERWTHVLSDIVEGSENPLWDWCFYLVDNWQPEQNIKQRNAMKKVMF